MQLFEDELFGNIPASVQAAEGANILKASLFTLIVVVKDTERTRYLQQLVNLITKKFPCKVIFISVDTAAKESFLTKNAITRVVGSGSTAISCDLLAIEVSEDQLQKVSFLVIPELLADLPSFLLVGHELSEIKTIVDQLESSVNRIVFDVLHLQNIGQFANAVLSLHHRNKYVDLNFARTKPWRETIAHVFNSKEAISQLSACTRFEIRYSHRHPSAASNSTPDTQPILLQAWLASRLGWQPIGIEENGDHALIRYTSGPKEVSVLITPTESNILDEGNIASIEIRGDNDLHYLLEYERDDRHIAIHASSQDRCEIPFSMFVGSFQRGRALPSEIFLQPPSDHYLPMLELLSSQVFQKERM
jgi:glucose-6-phosphate dehydrogenase assembly protein OpcA